MNIATISRKFVVILAVLLTSTIALVAVKVYLDTEQSQPSSIAGDKKNIQNTTTSSSDLACPENWEKFHHDVLGIAFCYPQEWGAPVTSPFENLTDISNMEKTFADQNTFYDHTLSILFKENKKVRVELFHDQYSGKSERDINEPYIYYESGVTDRIPGLRDGKSICDYQVEYDYRYTPDMSPMHLGTIESSCNNAIKTVLTKETKVFNFDNIGTLYTYDLKSLYFTKFPNTYFENAIISYTGDHVGQVRESVRTLEEYFTLPKKRRTGEIEPTVSREQFEQEREDFKQFVGTITPYKPIPRTESVFSPIDGEDVYTTIIRRYYWFLENKKFDEAYAMYSDKTGITLDEYVNQYKEVYSARPRDFKKLPNGRYEFFVDYREHNSSEQQFHVVMKITDEKIQTEFVEEILSEIERLKDMTTYSARRGNKNVVVLKQGENETIIDQAEARYDEQYSNIATVRHFGHATFSPRGNYILYGATGWEWHINYIYDVRSRQIIAPVKADSGWSDAHTLNFTPDEKHLYFCSSAGLASGVGGSVYSVPRFRVEYNVLNSIDSINFLSVGCSYDTDAQVVEFELSDFSDQGDAQQEKKVKIRYNLTTKAVDRQGSSLGGE